jgi:alkylation response protein AidB-like acyl-CoA dehydrogenase
MRFDYTEKQLAWRDELRAFLDREVTDELLEEIRQGGTDVRGPRLREFRKAVGDRGWYGLNWPVAYGGLGLAATEQQMLVDEFTARGVPGPDLTVTSVAPMIMRHGTEENKADWLPGIARGEITCAVGYSEPDAGTDLASLSTRAELDGDEWVINGAKIWNSLAHVSTHEWLCVRTDPTAPKHKGISVIMVPIDSPGIEIQPLVAWSDLRTNLTFFTDVRVPARNLIGEANKGWSYITGALDLERGALATAMQLRVILDELIEYCARQVVDGVRLADRPEVRHRLAALDADVEVARLLNIEAASLIEDGLVPTIPATEVKIFQSELRQRLADWGTQLLGMDGQLDWHEPDAPLRGRIERLYREAPLMRFGAGANEVLRDVIAQRGHGLPRHDR